MLKKKKFKCNKDNIGFSYYIKIDGVMREVDKIIFDGFEGFKLTIEGDIVTGIHNYDYYNDIDATITYQITSNTSSDIFTK